MFEHEEALKDFNTTYSAMPVGIKVRIQNWEREKQKVYASQEPDPEAERQLKAKSAIIANEIQDFMEKDLEEEEILTPNTNTMLSDADKHRAKALGLDENTATVADIEAKEKEKNDKEAADKAASEKEATDKAAAEAAEKEAKAKAAAQDDDDFVDGLM